MVKIRINQLQKELKDNHRTESLASWEIFCIETDHTGSWRKIKNFFKPKGKRDYSAFRLEAKTAKTNTQLRRNSLPNLSKDTSASRVTILIRTAYEYFYPPEDPDDYRSDIDDDHNLVADIDSDTLIRIVKFLKRGKSPGSR